MTFGSGLQQAVLISGHLSDLAKNGLSIYCTAAQFAELREERKRKKERDDLEERLRVLRLAELREEVAILEQKLPRISSEELKARLLLQEPYYRKIFFWA